MSDDSGAGLRQVRVAFDETSQGPLRDRVYKALRTAILAKDLTSGDRVTEAELCTALEVSRTPVREAFRTLQAEGLVTVSNSRGIVVRGISVQDFLEIYEIREALDILAARGAARNMTDETEALLRHNLELSEFLMERQRWDELRREFRTFHELIQAHCGNRRLSEMLAMLQDHSSGAPEFTQPTSTHAPSTLVDHRTIFDALRARDMDAAGDAARAHVRNERHELYARSPNAA